MRSKHLHDHQVGDEALQQALTEARIEAQRANAELVAVRAQLEDHCSNKADPDPGSPVRESGTVSIPVFDQNHVPDPTLTLTSPPAPTRASKPPPAPKPKLHSPGMRLSACRCFLHICSLVINGLVVTGVANGGPTTMDEALASSPVAAVRQLAAVKEEDRMQVAAMRHMRSSWVAALYPYTLIAHPLSSALSHVQNLRGHKPYIYMCI